MGEYGAYVNTPQTAADMNSILDAIGQEDIYYWGFSCMSLAFYFPKLICYRWNDSGSNLCADVPRPYIQVDHRWCV